MAMDDDGMRGAAGSHDDTGKHVVSWNSWRGDAQFGWFAYAPPQWWPKNSTAQFLLASAMAVGAKVRHGLFPASDINASDDYADWPVSADAWLGERWEDGCERFRLCPVREELQWIPDFEPSSTVAGIVDRGFPAYIRVLHPVEVDDQDGEQSTLRWRQLPGAQLDEPGWRPDRLPSGKVDYAWGGGRLFLHKDLQEPDESYLEQLLCDDLRARGFEGMVVEAWWDGYGGSRLDEATRIRIHQPGRELIPFGTAEFSFFAVLEDQGPSLIFPIDGAWVVANDTDLVSTYIGCTRELADVFLASPHLEVQEVLPGDRLG